MNMQTGTHYSLLDPSKGYRRWVEHKSSPIQIQHLIYVIKILFLDEILTKVCKNEDV